jgi:phosphocarrier protein HPr
MTKTATIEVKLKNKLGLHARPAAILVKSSSNFESEIMIKKGDEEVNGKSLIGLLMLAAEYNSTLKITAVGEDAFQALKTIENLILNDKEFLEE